MTDEYRQLAGLIADDRLRWLSNFLADEPQWDRRALLRLGSWATATVGALVVAMLSVHWTQQTHRDQVASLDLARQSQQLQTATRESQAENRRLTAAIETLSGDRDRLYARVTVLEQGLDSVTGAVTRQNLPTSLVLLSASVPMNLPPPIVGAPAVMPAHVSDPAGTTADQDPVQAARDTRPAPAAQAAPGAIGPPTQLSAALYAPPDPAAAKLIEAAPGAAPSSRDKPAEPKPHAAQNSAQGMVNARIADAGAIKPADKTAAKPDAKPEPKADLKPEPKADTKADLKAEPRAAPAPDPRIQVANVPPALSLTPPTVAPVVPSTEQPATEAPAPRTDFGVDLGSANSLDGLRALWQGLQKTDTDLLSPLHPIVVIRERSTGLGMQLRLVAGPLTDAAAAARICASLAEKGRSCEMAVYDGQRLSVRPPAEPAPAAAAPSPHPLARPAPTTRASNRHAAAKPPKHDERPPERAPEPPVQASQPTTTQSTPSSSSSILPEFLRGH